MVAAAHQAQFDLVLYIFNVEGTASWARAHQRAGDALGQCIHHFTHAGRGSALGAVDGQKRLHQCDGNLGGFERNHRAIAPNDLVVALRIGCCVGSVACGLFRVACGVAGVFKAACMGVLSVGWRGEMAAGRGCCKG